MPQLPAQEAPSTTAALQIPFSSLSIALFRHIL